MASEAKKFKDSEAPIIIKKEPKSVVLELGIQSTHEFSVEVELPADADTLTYGWYFRSQNKPGMQLKAESETSTLVIDPLSEKHAGFYFCIISCGSSERTVTTALAQMSIFKRPLSPPTPSRETLVHASGNSDILCSGSDASLSPKAEEIEHALLSKPNAKIICESFHKLKPDNSNPQDYSELASGFISAAGKSTSNFICLALVFVFHQLIAGLQCCVSLSFPIMRTEEGKRDNYADLAVVKFFQGVPVYPFLLVEVKTKKDGSNPLTQLVRYYEICRDEHIPLACDGRENLRHFPCYGLAFNQESKETTATLYGFATFVFKGKEETWISEIDSYPINKVSDVATVGKFLNKIRQRVKELDDIVKIAQKGKWLRVSSSHHPCLLPEDVECIETLSRSAFLCQDKSDSSHVVVKFLSDCDIKYTTDAQRFMAGEGFAPGILKEDTKENIKIVVMKKIEGKTLSEWLNRSTSTQLAAAKIISKLQVCLNRLHSRGYIHGDFRGPNILIEESGGDDVVVTIIDFEWSCKETSPNQYPELNQGLLWPSKKGVVMEQVHDHYHFAQLKAELLRRVRGFNGHPSEVNV